MVLQHSLIILLLLPILAKTNEHWSYTNTDKWLTTYPYCGGHRQSPIDLQFNLSSFDKHLKQMYLEEKNSSDKTSQPQIQLINNGHTAQLKLKSSYLLKNVAPDGEHYLVEQIHFHWGHSLDSTNGSEHLHEGNSYPLEMHMVTYSSVYSNISRAMRNVRGLAVVGAFFEVKAEANPLLQPIIHGLEHVINKNDTTIIQENFDLKSLIGEKRLCCYYRYDGSLTTPPCYESVVWSILQEPLHLSREQLKAFQNLHGDNSELMKNTYRTIQTIGSRILFRSFNPEDASNDEIPKKALLSQNYSQHLSVNANLILISVTLLMLILYAK